MNLIALHDIYLGTYATDTAPDHATGVLSDRLVVAAPDSDVLHLLAASMALRREARGPASGA